MALNPSLHDRVHVIADRTIIFLLVLLFAMLPFAAMDFSPFLILLHRIFLLGIGFYCALTVLQKSTNQNQFILQFLILFVVFLHSSVSFSVYGFDKTFKEIIILFLLYFIIIGVNKGYVVNLAKGVIAVTVFYCLDTIYQFIQGVDLFGFELRNGRAWGAFHYGSPSIAELLSLVFFLPYFFLKSLFMRTLVYIIFIFAMILANDRGPILQIVLSAIVFFPIAKWKRLLGVMILLLPVIFVPSFDPSAENRLPALFLGFKLFLLGDFEEFAAFTAMYGIDAYVDIWRNIYNFWFQWDNLIGVLFGSGWGIVPEVIGRPHNIHLELLISWGVFGYFLFITWLFIVYRRNHKTFVILAPCLLPVGLWSLTSANYLFVASIVFILFERASHQLHSKI